MGSSILTAVQSRAGLPGPRESSGQHCPSGEPWVSQKGAASVSLCSEGRRKHSSGPRASSWPRVIHHTPEVGACGHLHWVTLIILQGLTRSAPPDPRNLVLPSHSTPSFPAPALVFSSTKFSTCSRWPRVDGRGVHPRAGLAQHRGTHGHLGGETGWEERDGEGKTKSLQGAGRIKVRSVHGRQKGKGSTWQMDGKGLRSFSRSIVGGKDPVFPRMTRFGDLEGLCLRARGVRTRARFRACFVALWREQPWLQCSPFIIRLHRHLRHNAAIS